MGSHRPSDWHVLDLEKDPTPGDPHRVRSLAKNLHDFADDVGKVLRDIKGMAGDEAILKWVGKTADAFTEKFEDAPDKLKKLRKSYEMAGDALSAYWPELERAQTLADKALVKGREAQADLSSAKSRLSSADSWVDRAGKEADKYKDKPGGGKDVPKPDEDKVKAATRNAHSAEKAQKSAQGDVDSAKSALEAAKKMAADARKMREEAAGTAKKKIDEASDAGIPNRKWWEEIGDWVSDNWDTIVAVCKVVVAVVGIIAMIIGGPILAAIVIVAGAIVLADTLSKYAKGQATLMDVAFAAMDCVPGMKGITTAAKLAKGMKGLKGGLKGFKSARSALKDGAKGAYNRLRSKIRGSGDPVDVATGEMFLEATDAVLPGTLPLVFIRRAASGYRAGGWFGPTWSSTVDQRLEIDEEGVVFVTEDGMLLAYPHTVQLDEPVMPVSGPRWPLTRLGNGTYRIDDPIGGLSHFFATLNDDVALLQRITDRNDNAIDFDYDSDGTPLAIRHSGGYRLRLEVEHEHVTAIQLVSADNNGSEIRIKRYDYTHGNLTGVVNSSGSPMRFSYDDQHRITSWTDTNHRRYDYAYDDADRCIAQGGQAGHVRGTFSYDNSSATWPDCRVTTHTTAEGATSRFVINDNSQVIAEVDPLGGVTCVAYDAHHHMISRTDALGSTTRISNNALGQPVEVTRPDGSVSHYAYNALNLLTAIRSPDGSLWQREYDERGNCTAVTNPAGATTHYAFTENGHLRSVTNALGHTTSVRCDPAGLLLETKGPLGADSTWERDPFGRPVAVTDPLGHTTHLVWTVEGQLARRTTPDGAAEEWTYDGEGNCTSHTDATVKTSQLEYTHFDLVATRIGPDGSRYEFEHDPSLRLTKVTDPHSRTWNYSYDAAGRLISESDFDGRTVQYSYDALGRLTSLTNTLGQTIVYEHDTRGHVVRKVVDGQVSTFDYDANSRLVRATGPGATLDFTRDRAGRITEELINGRSLTYEYDVLGRRTRRVTPSGVASQSEYDEAGNRTHLRTSDHSIRFAHDKAGRESARHYGDHVTLDKEFDDLGRLTQQAVSDSGGHKRQRYSYRYRADGALTGVDDQLSGQYEFGMDATGRIRTVQGVNWTESYAYDSAGDQVEACWPDSHAGWEATGTRRYDGTRITRAGNVRYEHDALGRIVLRQKTRISRRPDTWRYEWDAEDRLTSVVTPDGTQWAYRYDPLGRRIAKQRIHSADATVVEHVDFTWDGTLLCEQTTTAQVLPDPVTLTWEYDGLHPVAQVERITATEAPQKEIDARFFAIVTDLVGTPTELVDEDGEISWRSRKTLWGLTTWATDSSAYTPLRFPGQYYDPETALHYNYFRLYDPEVGRYVTPDPLGLAPAPNPHTYVLNPHIGTDHVGLAPDCHPGVRDTYRGESQSVPGGQNGPAVSVDQVKRELGQAGMSVSDYDIVHVPEIRTPTGIAFGNSPHTADGFPMTGPRGLPLIEVSDIGLRSMDEAVATVNHEVFHHRHFELTRNSANIWGGSEEAAEEYGQRMLDQFKRRRG
ncbi:DUF6531 domain-containing protein [Streptomyces venezuelae]|uniref:DUF6531 domain-containing protein n=1 Tax=Streptomyces venezuelae TaxID=54571 RepID=UPI00341C78D2